jgi:hypothetical protein
MICQDQHLKEVFKQPPLTAFRRQSNLRDILIKAKVPPAPTRYPRRNIKGMTKCGNSCTACPYIMTENNVKVNETENWKIESKVTCSTFNCVYMLHCKKCGKRYIGETGRILRTRLSDHREYINIQVISATTGDNFNITSNSLANL